MRWLGVVCPAWLIGCHADPSPLEVASGRLVARITADAPRIELVLDGTDVWSTRPGQFAAIGSLDVTVEMLFGSFRFTEGDTDASWRFIERLDDLTPTENGAAFALVATGEHVGTGELRFIPTTRSGPDPSAAGFPRHVEIRLTAGAADRIELVAPCDGDEHIVGLGGQSFEVDHHGEIVPLWVQEDGIGKDPTDDADYAGAWFLSGRRHSTHTPMPMVLSSRGYAAAVDSDARVVFDLGAQHPDAMRFEVWNRELDLQVFVGEGPRGGPVAGAAARDALGHMIAWIGKPPRPPQTIFAPWIDAIFGSANVRQVAQELRDNGIPASVIWTEDWRGGTDGANGYELDEDWRVDGGLYPDFMQLAADLHAQGFALLTYQNTFLDQTGDVLADATARGATIRTTDGAPYLFTGIKFGPTSLLDLTNADGVGWAQGVMNEALALGADGWMADFGEWLPYDAALASGEPAALAHNRYPVPWARMNREMLGEPQPGRLAPLWFMRAAWLHSQPLVQVMWAGDQQTDFSGGDGFPSVIPIGLGLGLTGFPYFGSDIAGYMSQGTHPTNVELFERWTSLAAFTPVMRTHHGRSARDNVQWAHDASTIAHFRRWARFHMQLLPYQWGSIGSFERDGLPLMRLIALDYPDEAWAWTSIDEFQLGDRILVAPVEREGATEREVQLPAGTWYPLFGGAAVTGVIEVAAAATEIPVFVPEGALLVLYPDGVDTVLDAPGAPSVTTATNVGWDREVWLFPGTSTDAARAGWNDELGDAGPAQWQWTGRPPGPVPDGARWNGASIAVTSGAVTVIGDGVLELSDGGRLTIQRGHATARVTVRIR